MKKAITQMSQDILQLKDMKSFAQTNKKFTSQFSSVLDQYKELFGTLNKFPTELISSLPQNNLRDFFKCRIIDLDHYSIFFSLFEKYNNYTLYAFLQLFKKYFPDKTMMWYSYGMRTKDNHDSYNLIWRGKLENNNGLAVLILHIYKTTEYRYQLSVHREKIYGTDGPYCVCKGSFDKDTNGMATIIKDLIKSSLSNKPKKVAINNCYRSHHPEEFDNLVFTPEKVMIRQQQLIT